MARSRVKRFLPRPLLVAARRRRRQHRLLLALVALRHARLQQRAAERDHLRLRIDAEVNGSTARVERDREAASPAAAGTDDGNDAISMRGPQSVQSVPLAQIESRAPAPPSSQMPLLEWLWPW